MPSSVSHRHFSLVLCLLLFMTVSAGAESYPAGTRLSIVSPGEIKLSIEVAGPSLLWIHAEAPGLLELQAGTDEVWSQIMPEAGRAECVIPIYTSGSVEIRLRTRSKERVVVTTNYGLGEIVTDPSLMEVPLRIEPVMPVVPVVVPREMTQPEPVVPAKPPEPVMPKPVEQAPVSEPAPEVSKPAPPVIQETQIVTMPPAKRFVPFADDKATLIFGDVAQGDLAPSQPPAVKTFRVYAPNRASFEVVLSGNFALRIASEKPGLDMTRMGDEPMKRIVVPAPTSGFYWISIQGMGDYVLLVKSLD